MSCTLQLFRLADTVSHNPDKARDDILHRWSPALRQAMHNRSSSVIPAAQYLRSHRQQVSSRNPHPPYPQHLYTSTPHTSRPHTQHSDAALVADIDKRTTDVMINIINRTLTPERGFYDLVFFPLTGAPMQPPPSLLQPLTITLLLLLLFVQMLVQSACCCHEALTRTRCLSAATVRCTSRPSKATSRLQPPSSSMVPM